MALLINQLKFLASSNMRTGWSRTNSKLLQRPPIGKCPQHRKFNQISWWAKLCLRLNLGILFLQQCTIPLCKIRKRLKKVPGANRLSWMRKMASGKETEVGGKRLSVSFTRFLGNPPPSFKALISFFLKKKFHWFLKTPFNYLVYR